MKEREHEGTVQEHTIVLPQQGVVFERGAVKENALGEALRGGEKKKG